MAFEDDSRAGSAPGLVRSGQGRSREVSPGSSPFAQIRMNLPPEIRNARRGACPGEGYYIRLAPQGGEYDQGKSK